MKGTFTTYLALANVPLWYYGLKPPPNSIIHFHPFLGPFPFRVLPLWSSQHPITKTTCGLTPIECYHLYLGTIWNLPKFWICGFWYYYGLGLLLVLQILSLWNQTPKRKTLVAQGRVKFCDPLYMAWNWTQNLTLKLHRLNSPKCMHTYGGWQSMCITGKLLHKRVLSI